MVLQLNNPNPCYALSDGEGWYGTERESAAIESRRKERSAREAQRQLRMAVDLLSQRAGGCTGLLLVRALVDDPEYFQKVRASNQREGQPFDTPVCACWR